MSYVNYPLGQREHIVHSPESLTLLATDSGATYTNLGAEGAVVFSLPDTNDIPGVRYRFEVLTAQELRIDPPAGGGIYHGGAKQTDGLYIVADAIGESIEVISLGDGDWAVAAVTGTWTVESE